MGTGAKKVWPYAVAATVGISPESYAAPYDGTPAFRVKATLKIPDSDRPDEMDCLITLTARTALKSYQLKGLLQIDGQGCLRT
jgi:hypothetical protein